MHVKYFTFKFPLKKEKAGLLPLSSSFLFHLTKRVRKWGLAFYFLPFSTACLFYAFPFTTPVIAQTSTNKSLIRRVQVSKARGEDSKSLTSIQLVPGYGVNISFIPTGEVIEKVWLDNPSIVSIDTDGCLSGLGNECVEEGASILHLRLIKPIDIPELPKTNSSLLTVVTTKAKKRQIYLFRILTSKLNQNSDRTIEVVPGIEGVRK